MRRLFVAGCVLGLGAVMAPPAFASSVEVENYSYVLFTGDAGEANVVTFAGGGSPGFVTVTDDGAVLHVGPGCSSVDDHHATCQQDGAGFIGVLADLGDGDDQLSGISNLPIRAHGGDGDDVLNGAAGNDALVGGPGNDQISGGAGNDTLDDPLSSFPFVVLGDGAGADTVRGGPGTDWVSYLTRAVPVSVTLGSAGANDGQAGEGDDLGGDIENVVGTSHADVIVGGSNANHIYGWDGNDRLYGAGGADVIEPGDGADSVWGGNGDDLLDPGHNLFSVVYSGDSASDAFYGGAGVDSISYRWLRSEVHVSLNDAADDGAIGDGDNVHSDVENVQGGVARNVLVGSDAANVLEGAFISSEEVIMHSADAISGLGGDDKIYGRGGADILNGGTGNDTLDAAEQDSPYVAFPFGDPSVDDVDYVYGGTGNDTLFVRDRVHDRADCGPGLLDVAQADKANSAKDALVGCEAALGGIGFP